MEHSHPNEFRIAILKDYVPALLQDLVASGAIRMDPVDEHRIDDAETVVRRDRAVDDSKAADEKFRQFRQEAESSNPATWKQD